MKSYRWIILGIIACLVFAAGAYFWATSLMDSVYAYRSPLHNRPPASGDALGKPITRRVVFVLIDALREDTSLKPDVMPFLNELRQKGAWASMHSRPPSYSEPGYSVLLTGAWPDLSDGPTINLDYADIPTFTQDDLFSAAHRAGLKTGISGYYWFEKLVPQAAVSDHFYTPLEDRTADRQVVDAVLPWLKGGADQLVLIHLDQVDYAGHYEGGPRDPRWDQAARRTDDLLREIAATLDLSQDTLFISSDHGQIDRGGHGGQDPITLVEPWVLVGAGVKPGQYGNVNMVDVAPTLAALLGTNLPASNQGRVRTEMLALNSAQTKTIHTAFEIQQQQLLDAYQAAIGSRSDFVAGKDRLAAYQNTLQNARAARLKVER
ncbi:MAG TPA: alkaline phosphatase family protein, partial [Anaerolineales bacterium]